MNEPYVMVLKEVADVLAEHGALRCQPQLTLEGGRLVLTVAVPMDQNGDADASLDTLELMNAVRYVVDMGQMRALCMRYGIKPERLEALVVATQIGQERT